MSRESQIKSINTQLEILDSQYTTLQNALKEKYDEVQSLKRGIDKNEKRAELKKLKESLLDKEIIVSEHAILKYLERIRGINIEDIKKEILTDVMKKEISIIISGSINTVRNDIKCSIKVRNNTITTVSLL